MSVINCSFADSYAITGGAIYNSGNNLNVTNCNFTNNSANSTTTYTGGGAIYNSGSNVNVTNCNFINNSASINGGSIFNSGINLSVVNSIFNNNSANATSIGGGSAIYNYGVNLNVTNCTFTNNSANYGGGVYTYANNTVILDYNFTGNNRAVGLANTNFTLSGNRFLNNTVAIQFILTNRNYVITGLNNTNRIENNTYAVGISGTNSNYTVSDNFGSTNNGGFIFTGGSGSNNTILGSNLTGYNRAGSATVFFNTSSNNNKIIGCSILNNIEGIRIASGVSGSVINYNRILNNTNTNGFDMTNSGSGTNANYNWWGSNFPRVSGITLANYFVIELSAESYKTIFNSTYNRIVGLVNLSYKLVLRNNVSNNNSYVGFDDLPFFIVDVTWKDNMGTVINNTIDDARNTYSEIVYLYYNNNFILNAIADNENITLYLGPTVNGAVNLTFTKTVVLPVNVTVGSEIVYVITVTNHGPDTATNVVVTDVLDPRLVYVGNNAGAAFVGGTNTVVWNVTSLNVRQSVSLNITVRVNGTGEINNTANVTVDQPNVGNNSTGGNNSTVTLPPTVNLTITKVVVLPVNVTVGSEIVYVITVTNHGPDTASNVVVIDVLDPRLVYVGSVGSKGSYDPVTSEWSVGNLTVGDFASLNITVRVNGTGEIKNTANVTVDQPNVGNNSTGGNNSTVTLPPTVNLTITKIVDVVGNVTLGMVITYTITVTNHGPDDATGVVVRDVWDTRLVYVSSNATQGSYSVGTGLWEVGNISLGNSSTLSIIVIVNGTGNILNIANVTVDQPNVGNNNTDGGNDTTINAVKKLSNSTIVISGDIKVDHNVVVRGVAYDKSGDPLANVGLDVFIGDKTYSVTTGSDGSWSLQLGRLSSGNFNLFVRWVGNSTYYGFVSSTVVSVTKYNTKLNITSNVVKEGEKSKIKVTLKDGNGNALANKKVTITVKKKTYTGITNSKGVVIFKLKSLKGGKHRIIAKYSGNDYYYGSKVSALHKVKPRVDLAIVKVKLIKASNKRTHSQVAYYKVTIQNKGSLKSKPTQFVTYHIRNGIKIENKTKKIGSLKGGQKKTFIVKFYLDRDHHKYCMHHQYFYLNPKKTMNEVTYKNNKVKLIGKNKMKRNWITPKLTKPISYIRFVEGYKKFGR